MAQVLLTLTCPGSCREQKLTAYNLGRANEPIWVESVASGLKLVDNAVQEVSLDGVPGYSVSVENEGMGVVFRFPKGEPEKAARLDGRAAESIGAVSFDGIGDFRKTEAAGDDASTGDVDPAGLLANYRVPVARQKLRFYVAPNSVATYSNGDDMLLGGVTYPPDDSSPAALLVYRLEDGEFREDDRFRQIPISVSDCISAIGFGGDGKSLLIRHIDGSLQYVAAVGNGASIGWHAPGTPSPEASQVDLSESAPATRCDSQTPADDAVTERIVPIDQTGKHFALLDSAGVVWRVNVADRTDETAGDGGNKTSPRAFEPLQRLASGVAYIAGDPARGRIAIASGAGSGSSDSKAPRAGGAGDGVQPENTVTILMPEGVVTDGSAARAGAGSDDLSGGGTETEGSAGSVAQAPAATDVETRSTLPRRGEPKVVAFTSDGDVVVAYAGGRLANYAKVDGTWTAKFDEAIAKSSPHSVLASGERIAVVDDRDVMMAYELENGTPVGHARIPADPSMLAMLDDGSVLSVEWVTDSVASFTLRDLSADADMGDTARLVAMRSNLDPEDDATVSALVGNHGTTEDDADQDGSAQAPAADEETCAAEAMRRLSQAEGRLIGDAVGDDNRASPKCPDDAIGATLSAERLARNATSDSQGMLDNRDFSSLLAAAADGDRGALRLVGAVLARLVAERGTADATAIAEDAVRFGTSVPIAVLKTVAGGASIPEPLLDFASQRHGFDPTAHQLLASSLERRINDLGALTEALFQYAVAEQLYRDTGRTEEARFAAHRRAQLARLLPNDRVLEVDRRREAWAPEVTARASSGSREELPADAASRRALDLENVDRIAKSLPDSLLLAELRADLQRAHIYDLAASDPKQATEMMIDLGQRTGSGQSWSPDVAQDYLTLAAKVSDDPEDELRLSVAALENLGAAFPDPIHGNDAAVELFTKAADEAATAVAEAPQEAVAAMAGLELPFLGYQYATLPGTGQDNVPFVNSAKQVLQAAARLADAVSTRLGGDRKWDALHGNVLFWLGILVNDSDKPEAADIFQQSVDALQPQVGAYPDDDAARLRYAEALRWLGLTAATWDKVEPVQKEASQVLCEPLGEARLASRRPGQTGRRRLRLRSCQPRRDDPADQSHRPDRRPHGRRARRLGDGGAGAGGGGGCRQHDDAQYGRQRR